MTKNLTKAVEIYLQQGYQIHSESYNSVTLIRKKQNLFLLHVALHFIGLALPSIIHGFFKKKNKIEVVTIKEVNYKLDFKKEII